MSPVNRHLADRAQSIFDDLGYTVTPTGNGRFRAERGWKSVTVATVTDPDDHACGGNLRCFVASAETADRLHDRLERADPEFEWAIIAVESDREEYEVLRAPPAGH